MTLRRRRSRAIAAFAAVLLASVALAGCITGGFPGDPDGSGGTTTAPALDPSLSGTARYYQQHITWSGCGAGLECTQVTVPMDWSAPDGGKDIQLAVVKHDATGKKLGELFMDPGGPGASGYEYVHDYWDYFFDDKLAENYDLVGWDPRGVGKSSPVTCYTEPDDVENWLYGIVPNDPKTDPAGWIAATNAAAKDYVDACEEHTGEVLGYIDTESTVHDLDLLRAVVAGDQSAKLDYLGFSYGTDIGEHYIEDFPANVGRIVLDGVSDPSNDLYHVVLEQQAGFEQALTNYLGDCPTMFRSRCPFTTDVAASKRKIHALVVALDANPLHATAAGDTRELDGVALTTAISEALYDQSEWQDMTTMFSELFGSPQVTDTAFSLADGYYGFTPGQGYSDNLMDAFTAITCLDYPVETDVAAITAQNAAINAAAPTTADWTPAMVDPVCGQWPYQSHAAPPHDITGDGVAGPILVLSTTGDPATPYEWGVHVAQTLKTGVLVTHKGEGHTAYSASAGSCIRGAVDDYLVSGKVPASDPMCGDD